MDPIDLGTAPDGLDGDNLREAFTKVNTNFSSLPNVLVSAYASSATLALSDEYVRGTSGSATNITVPTNAAVAFPIGKQIGIRNVGAGLITLVAAGGVTLNFPAGVTATLRAQGSSASLIKVATNEWDVSGDLTAS